MIVRSLTRAIGPSRSLKNGFRMANRRYPAARRFSSSSSPSPSTSTPQSQASMLATITTDLDKIAPRFEIEPEQIQILKSPTEFYETLKVSNHTLPLFYVLNSSNHTRNPRFSNVVPYLLSCNYICCFMLFQLFSLQHLHISD